MEKKKKKTKIENKRRKINSKIIVTAILLLFAIVLVILLTANSINSNVKSKYYIDDMIHVENNTDNLEIQSNIVQDSGSLVMLISSKVSKPLTVTVNADFLNDDGDVIYSDQVSNYVMDDGKIVMNIILPNLDEEEHAGDIILEVTDEKANDVDFADASSITYEETHEIAEDNSTVFEITGTNNSNSVISRLEGSIVAFKDDNIVAFNNFNAEKIDSNSTFINSISLSNVLSGDEIVPLDYDKVLIFTSSASPA